MNITTDNNDSIAEPLYNLFEEIFELKDAMWLRKTIISFVQLTYDGTINKKIRQSIYGFLSEDMIVYYLEQIKNTFWVFNKNISQYELRKYNEKYPTDESIIENRNIAKLKLFINIPGKRFFNIFLSSIYRIQSIQLQYKIFLLIL